MTGALKKYCMALDLKNDPKKIADNIDYHQNVWPEINHSIKASGVQNAEIFYIWQQTFYDSRS